MKAVGLLFDFCLLLCNLLPIASCPLPDAPGFVAFIAMLLFTPVTMEVFAPPTAVEVLLFPTADPAPKRFGYLREFSMC